jgi:hypothetical protein
MRKAIAGFIVGAMLTLGGSALALTTAWRSESPYRAVVRCPNMAEDSAGHLKLVEYDRLADGTLKLVYRCRTSGY